MPNIAKPNSKMPGPGLRHLGQDLRVLPAPLLFELIEENDTETLSSVISKNQHDGGSESVLKLLNEARDEKGRSAVTLAVLARATVVCPGYMHLRYTITSIMATFPMYYIGTRARTASGCEQNVHK